MNSLGVFFFFWPLPGKNSLLRFDLCFNNKAVISMPQLASPAPPNFIKVERILGALNATIKKFP